ncbi:MAG: heparinase II/III family protein [Pseudomonadota bacterium]
MLEVWQRIQNKWQKKLQQKIRHHTGKLAYSSPLYNWSLGGPTPYKILFSPTDLWQGSADDARWLIYSGAFSIGGDRLELSGADWAPLDVDDQWIAHINGFEWLRDLRALGGHEGRQNSRLLIENWIQHFHRWDNQTWRPAILGKRLGHWLACYDYFGESANEQFQTLFRESVVKQLRHLSRSLPADLYGLDILYAIRGLAYGGLVIEDKEHYLEQALTLLDAEIDKQILSDGGHITRNPQNLLEAVRILIDIRCALHQGGFPGIEKIQHGLDRAVPALRFFRHGDGAFALFNGTQKNDADTLKKTVMHSGSKARTLNSLPHTGYERIAMSRSLLIVDTGKPPFYPHNDRAHTAPLAFEFSHGKDRIFVNCGTHPTCDQWQDALRSTPAHNALVIDDRNISDIAEDGSLLQRPKKVIVDRDDKKQICLIDACHDGYMPKFGISHRRRFYLAEKGHDLRGEDNLSCNVGLSNPHAVALRFHLHPNVMVSLVKNGTEALLRTKSGSGWRFSIVGGALSIEDSIYLAEGIRPRKTKQLVIRDQMTKDQAQFKWALQMET